VHDLENRPMTRMSPRRSYPPRIAITVAMAMLIAGCGSSPEARPTEPTSKVDAGTTAPSPTEPASKVEAATTAPGPRPSSTVEGPFGQVGGWIAYSSGDGIWALDPARPERRIQLSRGDGDPIAWSREGTKLLIRRGSPGPLAGVSVLEPDGTETHLIDGADDPTGGSFSPDGSEIVYAAGPWERSAIYAVSSDGGAPRLILRSTRRISGSLAFAYHTALSPDGTRIAYFDGMYDHSHSLWVANADGTERRVLLDDEFSHPGHVRALKWSPDGEWLAFATDGSIYVVRPDGTGLRPVVRGLFGGASAAEWSPDGSRIAYLREGGPCVSPTGEDGDLTCEAELVIVNVDGGDEQIIEGIRTPEIGRARIAWNPRV
jgi:WD40 domain-containing protein/WD40 repeat protein